MARRIRPSIRGVFQKIFSGFTLVELIVVVAILAILATIGFLALSGYSQDAKDASVKANVRSVYSAIAAESALTGNSPRYYVIHDSGAALTGAVVYVDGSPTTLTGGDWNQAGTNYSAGNPDYAKLKINGEKFKVSALDNGNPDRRLDLDRIFGSYAMLSAAYDSKYLSVGAMDAVGAVSANGKRRSVSYFQVAGVAPSTGMASVSWNYPTSISWSVAGLVKDPTSATGALMDGSTPSSAGSCPSSTQSVGAHAYAVPAFSSGATYAGTSSVTVVGGTQGYAQNFACANGTVSTSGTESTGTLNCTANGYASVAGSCVPNSCFSIKTAYPASADGTYSIDPDGAGGIAAFTAYCDMTVDGGGWTLVAKSSSSAPVKLNNTGNVGTVTDVSNANGKLSDAQINGILTTSSTKIIRAESPSIPSYRNYIKIDSVSQAWTTTARMCNMRWSDGVGGPWTKMYCTYQATGQVNGGPGGPNVTDCTENTLSTSGINYAQKTDGTCSSTIAAKSAYFWHDSYSSALITNGIDFTTIIYNTLWWVR